MKNAVPLQVMQLSCVRQGRMLFRELSLSLQTGELLFVQGENGAGKSSFLRLLAGLATPASGDIHWYGTSIQQLQTDYGSQLHYLGHLNGIKLGLTVKENLQLATHLQPAALQTINKDQMAAILTSLQLDTHCHTPARYLSAGQKRRLGLAKLFLFPKKFWILDEPLTALDQSSQTFVLQQIENHLQQDGLCVISSHHPITSQKNRVQTLRLGAC